MELEEILSHIDKLNLNKEDTSKLVEDSKLFELEEDSGQLRPINYNFMKSRSNNKLRSLDDRYLVLLANTLRNDLIKINAIQPDYVVSEGQFTLETWSRIFKRELYWRKETDNRIYRKQHS